MNQRRAEERYEFSISLRGACVGAHRRGSAYDRFENVGSAKTTIESPEFRICGVRASPFGLSFIRLIQSAESRQSAYCGVWYFSISRRNGSGRRRMARSARARPALCMRLRDCSRSLRPAAQRARWACPLGAGLTTRENPPREY